MLNYVGIKHSTLGGAPKTLLHSGRYESTFFRVTGLKWENFSVRIVLDELNIVTGGNLEGRRKRPVRFYGNEKIGGLCILRCFIFQNDESCCVLLLLPYTVFTHG